MRQEQKTHRRIESDPEHTARGLGHTVRYMSRSGMAHRKERQQALDIRGVFGLPARQVLIGPYLQVGKLCEQAGRRMR